MTRNTHFRPALFTFLRDLRENNSRDWFRANRDRYEADVKGPALQFIVDFGPHLRRISPHFRADPRPVGGSLFRIYRDTRFSRDKSPYKTHAGLHFRHEAGKDAYTPGFYLHLEPRAVFVGIGIWHPDGATLKRIRGAIAADPERWLRARDDRRLRRRYDLVGDRLQRPPRGFDPDERVREDLLWKDFTAVVHLSQKAATAPGFLAEFAVICRDGAPYMRFLCEALGLPF
jgi:uncharacterized protein (TIGR02453 family)